MPLSDTVGETIPETAGQGLAAPDGVWADGIFGQDFGAAGSWGSIQQVVEGLWDVWPFVLLATGVLVACLLGVGAYLWYRRVRDRRRERISALFDASPGPLLLLDERRRVLETNEAAATLLGRSPKALNGRRLTDFLIAGQSDSPEAAFEALDDTRNSDASDEDPSDAVAQGDVQVERPDGTLRRVRLRLRDVPGGSSAGATAATLQDVTALSDEHALFQHFHRRTVGDMPLQVSVLSPEGTYIYANSAACIDSVEIDWLRGKTDFDLCERLGLHPEVALRRRSHRRRALQEGERVQFQEVLSRRDAPARQLDRFYTPIFEDDGSVYAVVTYAIDRTDETQQAKALEEAQHASAEYEEMKVTLMRNLRHEFRTPLTSVLSAAEILKDDVSPASEDFVEIIRESGERLLTTLNAMLDLAGTQTGGWMDRKPRVVDLDSAVEEVVGDLSTTAEKKGIFLRRQSLTDRALVRADPAGVYRVLRSIIGNAVKFTREGGIVVEVSIEKGTAEARVIDTGVGISEAGRAKLFEAFRQEDGSMTRHFEGVGVGLSVAKKLLSLMGGDVSVDSQKGEGSVFTIRLPLAFENAEGDRPRVLLIEPKEEQRRILRHHLGAHAHMTFTGTLDAALGAFQAKRFAAVFASTGLGQGNPASDLVQRFRALDGGTATPLIAVDKQSLPGAAEQFEADGYDGYVARPFRRFDLLNALGDALGQVLASRLAPAQDSPSKRNAGAL